MSTRFEWMQRTSILVTVLALAISVAPLFAAEVELGGYCPVAYAAMGQAVKGDPNHVSEFQGKTYYLANAKAKKMFDQDAAGVIARADTNWAKLSRARY